MSPSVEPFNEAKYKALMDGLEIIEVPYKKLTEIIDYRIEAEYFSKKFIENEQLLAKIPCKKFSDIANAINGRAYSSEAFSQNGDLYVSKIGDVTNKRGIENWDKLSIQEFVKQKGKFLADGDILMTLTGDPPDVGKVSLISTDKKECTWNQRVAKISTFTDDYRSNYALYAVLSSELCRVQMERFAKGIRQRNLGNDCFGFIDIPIFSDDLQKRLENLIKKHIHFQEQAKTIYLEAEDELKNHMGITQSIHTKSSTIKFFKEAFERTGRFDSEYYHPKYETIENQIKGDNTVSNSCTVYDANYIPNDTENYQYIELANVDTIGGIISPEIILGKNLPTRARRIVKKGQVITSSIEGSLQSCALITDSFDNSLCSTGFFVLDSSKYNAETLLVIFKSSPIQELLKKRCSGTILTGISKEEFLKMPLPEVDSNIQISIKDKIRKSYEYRKKSNDLLEIATKTVGMAVERNEAIAIEWLKEKGVEC